MRQLDERILEYLDESGESNPDVIAEHPRFDAMDVSKGQIRKRIQMVADAGLVGKDHIDIYEVTTW